VCWLKPGAAGAVREEEVIISNNNKVKSKDFI
jgi:hypothetical protein